MFANQVDAAGRGEERPLAAVKFREFRCYFGFHKLVFESYATKIRISEGKSKLARILPSGSI